MKLFANKENKLFFLSVILIFFFFSLVGELIMWILYRRFSLPLLILFFFLAVSILTACYLYLRKQNNLFENAVAQIESYLDGNRKARIECDSEGEIYRLFHSVNNLAAVLNAHAEEEIRDKAFLKNTISDISHQLKTPLAALNIYNGLLQNETDPENIKEFTTLSEQELDRIETLVQNMLKVTKLDAGAIVFEKQPEYLSDLMKDIQLHFSYRARQEKKSFTFSGSDSVTLLCDRSWLTEAISNIVKNAFDHTRENDCITVSWSQSASMVQIKIEDTGSGIHPEDIHYIFKRFYRSRFSSDTQGIGLGLPLAKAIIEAHSGTIEVQSEPGRGSAFTIHFLNPTKL